MPTAKFEIKAFDADHHQRLLNVWEQSVIATHEFLAPADYVEIRDLVHTIEFNQLPVYCLVNGNIVAGFICVIDKKLKCFF